MKKIGLLFIPYWMKENNPQNGLCQHECDIPFNHEDISCRIITKKIIMIHPLKNYTYYNEYKILFCKRKREIKEFVIKLICKSKHLDWLHKFQ